VYRNHLKAHKEVYDMAKKRSRRFKVGFVKSYSAVRASDDSRLSRFMAWGDRLVRDRLVLRYVGRKTAFIGANYYFSDAYKGVKIINESDYISDMGWEMHRG
jgi:beta-glucosidase/6-phospho-beta-glucosidase/beta-galactosidase